VPRTAPSSYINLYNPLPPELLNQAPDIIDHVQVKDDLLPWSTVLLHRYFTVIPYQQPQGPALAFLPVNLAVVTD